MLLYDKDVDKILDGVETYILKAAGFLGIVGGEIPRWRWDQPDITLTWATGQIGKSLHVTMEESDKFTVEIAAWKDIDEPAGQRKRKLVRKSEEVPSLGQ